ncbi:MAG: MFS transporter [Armatimonadetes bacterium]|nr:MFS transporter [Armatimonadota bacterium]
MILLKGESSAPAGNTRVMSPAGTTSASRQTWMLLATVFLVMVGFGIVMPILPFLARRFGASSLQMGLLITAWAVAQFAASPFWGLAADRIGRKPVLIIGLFGYTLAFLGMALAQSYEMLLAARVVGGLISASVLPSAQAIAADLSAPEERSTVMGRMGAGFGLGFLVGPAAGGILALAGPLVPFHVAAATSALAVPLVVRLVREPPPDARRAAAARLGTRALAQALRSPELPLYLMALATTWGGSSLFSMLGYYAIDRAGGTPADVGVMFTALGLGSVVAQGIAVGPVTRRLGEVRTIRAGFVAGAAGFLVVALAGSVAAITVAVCMTSLAMAFLRPSLAALNSRTTRLGYGTSLGMQTSFDSLGRALGPLGAGTLYGIVQAGPFLGAAAVYLVAAVGALRLQDGGGRRPTVPR